MPYITVKRSFYRTMQINGATISRLTAEASGVLKIMPQEFFCGDHQKKFWIKNFGIGG